MQNCSSIDVDGSINSGQVFLWRKSRNYWYGVNGQDILRVDNSRVVKSYQNAKTDFFRDKDDMRRIIESISRDKTTEMAVKRYPGLRLLRQDPFQCLISFIVSSNSNIQKIKTNLESISEKFGERVEFEDQEFFLFARPEELAKASTSEIRDCGVGYRAGFIKKAADMIFSKEIDLEHLRESDYYEAKKSIRTIPGVGNKVADCVMLFSLDKLEAFPLDRWMIRILGKYFFKEFQLETKTITERQYGILHEKIVDYFGPYAGYAQQFLFKMERDEHQRRWL